MTTTINKSASHAIINAPADETLNKMLWQDQRKSIRPLLEAEMTKHGLTEAGWKLQYGMERATKTPFRCNFETKVVTLAAKLLSNGKRSDVRNALLVAIAMVHTGPHAGKHCQLALATKFGADLQAYAQFQMVKPSFIQYCSNGCIKFIHKQPRANTKHLASVPTGLPAGLPTNIDSASGLQQQQQQEEQQDSHSVMPMPIRLCSNRAFDGRKCGGVVSYGQNDGTDYTARFADRQNHQRHKRDTMPSRDMHPLPQFSLVNLGQCTVAAGDDDDSEMTSGIDPCTTAIVVFHEKKEPEVDTKVVTEETMPSLDHQHQHHQRRERPIDSKVAVTIEKHHNTQKGEEDVKVTAEAMCNQACEVLQHGLDIPALKVLEWLSKLSELSMTEGILRRSPIGKLVNVLRTRHPHPAVQNKAIMLIREWTLVLRVAKANAKASTQATRLASNLEAQHSNAPFEAASVL